MISGRVEQYKQLSQFHDLKEFNAHFEQFMVDLKGKFSKGETIALKRLVRYSAKISGVCYAKIQTLVSATHKQSELAGISRSTFERMLRKAKQFGLIEVVNTKSKTGRQAHNVYVFQKYKQVSQTIKNEVVKSVTIEVPIKPTDIKTNNNIDKELRTIPEKSIDIIPSWINKQFAQKAGIYFHNAQITELYRIGYIHSKMLDTSSETLIEALNEGLDVLVYKYRNGKIKSLMGFWNGICKKLIKKYWIIDTFDNVEESLTT